MWKKWKRITCSILTAAMLLAELPMNAMAVSNAADTDTGTRAFGDADGNGELNAKDIELILQYIVEDNPSGFYHANADVTGDGVVDLKDLLAVRKAMAGQGSGDGTTTAYYQVTFALGNGQDSIGLPAAKTYAGGTRIDALPTPV